MVTVDAISRRALLKGTYALAWTSVLLSTASALSWDNSTIAATEDAHGRRNMRKEDIIRAYYTGWEKKDWQAVRGLLADDFTFSSPNDDDHIDVQRFHVKCWPQSAWVQRFDLEIVVGPENDAFVKTLCRTTNGKSMQNVEYFRFVDGQIRAIECYFGSKLGYPSKAAQS
jgi:SnoaL-like domain